MGKKDLYVIELQNGTVDLHGTSAASLHGASFNSSHNRPSTRREIERGEQKTVALRNYYATAPEVRPSETANGHVYQLPPSILSRSLQSLNARPSVIETTWPRRFALLLTCFSASVGLGNVWRFPKVALENGGGAFLIVYIGVVILFAQPLHFLELALGQFSSKGPLKVWKCFPVLKGLGYSQLVITFYLSLNLSLVMSWAVFYLSEAFREQLPWVSGLHLNWNGTNSTMDNMTVVTVNPISRLNASIQHWRSDVLEDPCSDDAVMTRLNWKLTLFLVLVWVIVFLCLLPGIQGLRKMTYVTCIPPYICLTALLIYLLTWKETDTNRQNLLNMLTPDWEHLKNIQVWYAACQQAFMSLNLAFGQLILFSSYNEFNHSVLRDSLLICGFDTFASILAFCTAMTVVTKSDIELLTREAGFGFSFISYSNAIGRIKIVPQLWNSLFFLMIFFLGLGNVVSLMSSLLYNFNHSQQLKKHRKILSFGICLSCLCLGIVFTTDASLDILTSLDTYGIGFCVVLLAILETIGIAWGYGIKQLYSDMNQMFNSPPSLYWKVSWSFVFPVSMTVVLVYCHIVKGPTWVPKRSTWPFIFGWIMAGIVVACVPVTAYFVYRKSEEHYGFREKVRSIFRPEKYWGPNDLGQLGRWRQNNDATKSAASSGRNTPRGLSTPGKNTPRSRRRGHVNEGFDDTAT